MSNDFEILDFHSLEFAVGNAKTAADYFVTRFGFKHLAYRGLETGHRVSASHAVRNGQVVLIFTSSLDPGRQDNDHVSCINVMVRGSTDVVPYMSKRVRIGYVKEGEVADFFSVVRGWKALDVEDAFTNGTLLPLPQFEMIDHVVNNYKEGDMEKVCDYLAKGFNMRRFWSVDDSVIHTEYSSLKSVVMSNANERVLLPINEPAKGKKRSQIQEYLDYNNNEAGVQHIALRTLDIVSAVAAMRARGVKFLQVPSVYYDDLKERLRLANCVLHEDVDELANMGILVDFDESGYLLQIFTEPIDYRPTVFFEVIQRRNHKGFGAGNFLVSIICCKGIING